LVSNGSFSRVSLPKILELHKNSQILLLNK